MRIFAASASFKPDYGGPAVSVSHLAAAVADLGAVVGLWAPDGSAVTSEVVPCCPVNLVCLTGPLQAALQQFGRPDVIHDSGLWLPHNHQLAMAAHKQSIPRIVSTRGMLEPWAMGHKRLRKIIAWAAYQRRDINRADLIHATAEAEADSICARGILVPVVVIPNGTELPDFQTEIQSGNRKQGRTALFLSRIHPKKGLPMLIEAWGKLRPHNWRLIIIGPEEAGHRSEVERLISALDLTGAISIRGSVSGQDKIQAYQSADLFILPTHSENFGMVVAEALSHAVPVLTTHGAPWSELETAGCGWWVEPSVPGLLSGLREATRTPAALLREMGRRGRDLVESRFTWTSVAERFLAIYSQLVSQATMESQRQQTDVSC